MAENAIAVQEKPMLFSGAMVRAIIEGRKTQTRRVFGLKLPDYSPGPLVHAPKHDAPYFDAYDHGPFWCWWSRDDRQGAGWVKCPYGKPGDRLWVRETSRVEEYKYGDNAGIFNVYLADNALLPVPSVNDHAAQEAIDNWWRKHLNGKNIPSIFMPRWASRLTLEIVSVKVERVQDISFQDCLAEGVIWTEHWDNVKGADIERYAAKHPKEWTVDESINQSWEDYTRLAFQGLWDSINEKRGYGWAANPWTWAIQFRVLAAGGRRA